MESDVANGGSSDYIRAMDRRHTILETRFDTILPTLATKADLEQVEKRILVEMRKGFSDMHKWVVGTCIVLILGFGGMSLTMLEMINTVSDRLEHAVVTQQRR